MNHSYPFTPLIVMTLVVTFVLLAVGGVCGFSLSGSELLRPWSSQANAESINVNTDHQKKVNEQQELRDQADTNAHTEQVQIQTESMRAQAEADKQYHSEMNATIKNLSSELASTSQNLFANIAAVLPFCLVILTIGRTLRSVIWQHHPSNQASGNVPDNLLNQSLPPHDPWHDKKYRYAKIAAARQKEKEAHEDEIKKDMIDIQDHLFFKRNGKK